MLRIKCKVEINNQIENFHITYKNKSKEITPLSLLNSGKSFLHAGHRNKVNQANNEGGVTSLTIPSLVNYLFSIELFLKGICQYEGVKIPHTHKIKDLCTEISQKNYLALAVAFNNAWLQKQPLLNGILIKIKNECPLEYRDVFVKNINTLIGLNFEKLIDLVSNYFVTLRYDFENLNETDYLDYPIEILAEIASNELQSLVSK